MDSGMFGGFDEEPQIDLTPLIDCLFMLIIFFVLTMSFSRPVLEIVLPEAQHAEVGQERNELLLCVKDDGKLYINEEPVTIDELGVRLDADPEKMLNIYMDEKAPFSSFVEVLDLAKVKRSGRFVISTRAEGEAAPAAAQSEGEGARP